MIKSEPENSVFISVFKAIAKSKSDNPLNLQIIAQKKGHRFQWPVKVTEDVKQSWINPTRRTLEGLGLTTSTITQQTKL
jgi:1,2-phenylacetyl-CoA epoxidase catalytic subunit